MTSPEIYSLLVPLASGRLLVPRTCVAEITGFVQPAAMPGAPPWYLGMIPWNGRQVPLVSFEGICGEPIPEVTSRSRVLLLHVLGSRLETTCYGIVSQGFPQLMRVGPEVIRPDPGYVAPAQEPVICRVRLLNETPRIPDFERLERLVADETSSQPN